MLSGAKDGFFSVFKWKGHRESSLSTGFLEDVHHEIEMSDYQRAPSPGSESPSGLLDGESLNVEPIADLDLFFEGLYSYYCEKGLWCIVTKWIVELLSLAFTICFSGFFLLIVDWNGLRNAKCGMDAVESGIKPCDLAKDALHQHPLTPFTFSKGVIVGYLSIFSIYWVFCFLRFFAQLKDTLKIRQFYCNSLSLTDNEIQTTSWASILEKVVKLQSSQQLCVIKDLSAHDVVMRMMRKENYLIGMLNKGVIAFPISQWVPGAGPTVKFGPDGTPYRLILSKTLEWTLNWCILQSMFDRNFCVRRDFISDPKTLQKRLMVVGLVVLLFSPFLVIFMLVYLFLRHAEQFYNHPSTASSRRWSNLSKWIVREFNEVEHLFKHRINGSVPQASDYMKQFPSPIITIIAKFISFVSGGFAAILIIIAFLEESLLEGHIFGRNLLWYAAVFGTITAISRAAVTDELLVLDPQGAMSLVVQQTHYMPKRWRGKENTDFVRMEFESLFQYTGMMLLEEMASIFLTPYLLIFVVPKRVDDILQFIKHFTVNVEGVGHVCSFSVFDFQSHGNSNYGSPYNSPSNQRSSQGKMEKSFLSFHSTYPTWEPNADGKQFLSTLKKFRDKMLQQGTTPTYFPSTMQQQNPTSRNLGDRNNNFSRETTPNNHPITDYQLSSAWMMMDDHQKTYPYILDWFYTSQPHRKDGNSKDIAVESFDPYAKDEEPRDLRIPLHVDKDDEETSSASTSASLLAGSVLRQNDVSVGMGHRAMSLWWDRRRRSPNPEDPQTSFCEPPNFIRNNVLDNDHDALSNSRSLEEEGRQFGWRSSDEARPRGSPNGEDSGASFHNLHDFNYNNTYSDRSLEEEDRRFGWKNSEGLSKTFYMGDSAIGPVCGEFDLPFDGIYSTPADDNTSTMNSDP